MTKIRFFKGSFCAVGTCCLIGLLQGLELNQINQNSTSLETLENTLEEKSQYLELISESPSIGFSNVKANVVFLDFLQYLGDDSARANTGYTMSATFFQSIIEDDPHYLDFYLFLSGSSSLIAGMPDETVELMKQGLENLAPNQPSNSFYLWRYKAVDELLFLGESQAAQESFQNAASWAQLSDHPDSDLMADISGQTAQFLSQDPDSRWAQINAWGSVLANALDNDTRNRAATRIRELGGDIVMDENGNVRIEYAKADQDSDS
ncbi:MAG: hypothetical protein AAFV85_20715 [Cyanobacteria bacterium J06634_6]